MNWLEAFAASVRNRDFASGEALFSREALGFGTRAAQYQNRAELRENQWKHVWPKTTGFRFDLGTLQCIGGGGDEICAAICRWESQGVREDGSSFPRAGRCTIVLQRSSDEAKWRAVHTHFSMNPASSTEDARPTA